MPDPGPAGYMIEHLMDAGPALHTGMGPVPLSWVEIESWQRGAGIALTPWEAQTMRRMSLAYVSEQHAAQETDAPPPYAAAPDVARRAAVSAGIAAIFGARSKKG